MIDPHLLRTDPDLLRASQRDRGEDAGLVDALVDLDERRRSSGVRFDTLRAEQKGLGREVAKASGEAKTALLERAMSLCDVLIGSDAEFAATRLRPDIVAAGGPIMLVLKHGPEGVSLVTAMGTHDRPGIAVDVVCGLGAGDALTASFAAGLIRGLDPVVAVERGNAAGAIVASRLMCSASMPTQDEIDGLLARVAVGSAEVKA